MQTINSFVLEKFGRSPLDTKEAIRRSTQNRVDTYNETSGKDDNTGVHCELCRDRGDVAFVDDKTGNFTIRPCKCFGSRLTIQRLQSCGVWTRAQRCKLSDFETETATQQILKQTTESFIENPEGRWLCLCGQSGSGKTFLTTAAFVELSFKLGVAGRYLQWNQDSRALKAATLEDPESLWESYKTADLLLLDDVFKGGLPSTADVKMLFEILDFRYNNELTTILSTELTFDQLLEVDQATASRIRQKCGPFLVSISPDVSKNYRLR